MLGAKKDHVWMLVAAGGAALAGMTVRNSLKAGWRTWREEDPPHNPAAPDVTWREALLWSAATGLLVGVGRAAARRGLSSGWRKVTGSMPPI